MEPSMKLDEISKVLEAAFLYGKHHGDREIQKAGASDLMSDILSASSAHSILLTGLATEQVIRTASIAEVASVILIRGKVPSDEIIFLAEEEDLPLLTTKLSMFVASGRLYQHGIKGLDLQK